MRLKLTTLGITILISSVSAISGYVFATSMNDHGNHHGNEEQVNSLPIEAGQSAFAAIAEIVKILNTEPNTDWEKVNITALREHLVDMNALTLGALVEVEVGETDDRVKFSISGPERVITAIQNMVPAHAKELTKMDDWDVEGIATDFGAVLLVKTSDSQIIKKVKALGFFGLIATGAHHQPHHLGMARGDMRH